jgi:NAD(P)-dependent dehydrogenase (short-subunit alcohol dehydrogenase family)
MVLMNGQRILVTGGGTGLGQAMAERFLALGADVAICGRRKAVCDERPPPGASSSPAAASTPSAWTSASRRRWRRW